MGLGKPVLELCCSVRSFMFKLPPFSLLGSDCSVLKFEKKKKKPILLLTLEVRKEKDPYPTVNLLTYLSVQICSSAKSK